MPCRRIEEVHDCMSSPTSCLLHADIFHRRIEELRKHILGRPERCIAVVTHSGVLEALTGGVLFRNGEIRTLTSGELIARTGEEHQ